MSTVALVPRTVAARALDCDARIVAALIAARIGWDLAQVAVTVPGAKRARHYVTRAALAAYRESFHPPDPSR